MNVVSRTAAIFAAFVVFSGPASADDWSLADQIDMPQTLDAGPDEQEKATGCEQYGKGAVRLHGSETCVRISGSVEFSIGVDLD